MYASNGASGETTQMRRLIRQLAYADAIRQQMGKFDIKGIPFDYRL